MNLFIMAKIFCKKKKTKIFSLNISIYDYFYAKKKNHINNNCAVVDQFTKC